MHVANEFDALFSAFQDAQAAYERLRDTPRGRSDQELARDADYRQLHRSGMALLMLGGEAAVQGAVRSICRQDGRMDKHALQDFQRFWAGMARMGDASGEAARRLL